MNKTVFAQASAYSGCILDTERRFVFFCHNKVAQTSINRKVLRDRAIVKKDGCVRYWIERRSRIRTFDGDKPFCFTIVRNPYTRVVSAFEYLKRLGKIDADRDFKTFVERVLWRQRDKFDRHFWPQKKWPGSISEMEFDYIGYYECLDADWKIISRKIGAPRVLPHNNRTAKNPLQSYYDERTKKLVYSIYQDDFEAFGYRAILPS